ncbi:MAG TPA: serine/threonine-protein kinase [Pseudonocardia sp.]|uniref:serine/threonine-protein kinase n=1 Tax=Pseudonocardia sp. TaxID=60912 RepID=UPI002BDE3F92|nr:serine/threonine-protein kinase [Pseudonocardia sp.]HTF48928.1 serine/threonine-protein kinase [Pseudonocardia sp.]
MSLTGESSPLVLAQRYRLEERVGAGSMGAVWRATDELLGRTVAVKQLLLQPGAPGFGTQGQELDEARQRIMREGRLAARLQHQHAIAVFDVVLHNDTPWLVMEYLPSRTLGALLVEEGPLGPRDVAAIGRQIADGLAAAHAAGIVHRDIKPGNVLIGPDGIVKITDFGVSRAADDVQLTRTGLIAGTPAYLAPETARGLNPTTASDVFALGSTLYTAVEGEPPFGLDENAYALLYKVGAGTIRPPERAGPLTGALLHMLRTEPDERPTAARAREELAAVVSGRPMADPMPGRANTQGRRAGPGRKVPGWKSSPARGDYAGAEKASERPEGAGSAPPSGDRRTGLTGTRVDLNPLSPTGAAAIPLSAPAPPPPSESAVAASPMAAAPRTAPQPVVPSGGGRSWPGTGARPGGRRRPSGAMLALIALAVLAVAAVATLIVVRPSGVPVLSGPSAVAPSAPAAAPSISVRPGAEPSAAELESFIRGYYGLLPGQPAAGWALLGDSARSASNGYQSYLGFYNSLASISFAEEPTAVDSRTVRATLRFVPKSGGESVERYQFTVVPDPDGKLIMSSFARG